MYQGSAPVETGLGAPQSAAGDAASRVSTGRRCRR